METVAWDGRVDWDDRFWSKVHPEALSGCWLWHGAVKNRLGHGQTGRNECAHRRAFLLAKGPIPAGLFVLHRCNVPACVNPSHLYLGTNIENSRDKIALGRQARGESHGMSRLTTADILDIRRRLSCGEGGGTIAARYQIGSGALSNIRHRVRWGHV